MTTTDRPPEVGLWPRSLPGELRLEGRRLCWRADLNAPMSSGSIVSDQRLRTAAKGIKIAADAGARVVVRGHLGGETDQTRGWPVMTRELSALIGGLVRAVDVVDGTVLDSEIARMAPGDVLVTGNLRSDPGETSRHPTERHLYAKRLARGADLFVNDAFATSHRNHASITSLSTILPSVIGPSFAAELTAIKQHVVAPGRLVAVLGGDKLGTKGAAASSLAQRAAKVLVGGRLGGACLAALGLVRPDPALTPDARMVVADLLRRCRDRVVLPVDVVTLDGAVRSVSRDISAEAIADIGPDTLAHFDRLIQEADRVVWNGPVGRFELPGFDLGTRSLSESIARAGAQTLVGGGHTVASIAPATLKSFTHVSTGGGAFLSVLSGTVPLALNGLWLPDWHGLSSRVRP